MNAIVLQPTNALPLWFLGHQLTACTSRRSDWDDAWFAERWFDFVVWQTDERDYVLAIRYDCVPRWMDEDDPPHLSVFRCRSVREVHRRLNDHDYRSPIGVNFVPCERLDVIEMTQLYVDELIFDARIMSRVLIESIQD